MLELRVAGDEAALALRERVVCGEHGVPPEAGRDARATEAGARRVMLHAQERARSLYARGGYQPAGEPFMEEGLPHIAMEKTLA